MFGVLSRAHDTFNLYVVAKKFLLLGHRSSVIHLHHVILQAADLFI